MEWWHGDFGRPTYFDPSRPILTRLEWQILDVSLWQTLLNATHKVSFNSKMSILSNVVVFSVQASKSLQAMVFFFGTKLIMTLFSNPRFFLCLSSAYEKPF